MELNNAIIAQLQNKFKNHQAQDDEPSFDETTATQQFASFHQIQGIYTFFNVLLPNGTRADIKTSGFYANILNASDKLKQITLNYPDNERKIFVDYNTYFARDENGNTMNDTIKAMNSKHRSDFVDRHTAIKYVLAVRIPQGTIKGPDGLDTTITNVILPEVYLTLKGKRHFEEHFVTMCGQYRSQANAYRNAVAQQTGVKLPYYAVTFLFKTGGTFENPYFDKETNKQKSKTTYHVDISVAPDKTTGDEIFDKLNEIVTHTFADGTTKDMEYARHITHIEQEYIKNITKPATVKSKMLQHVRGVGDDVPMLTNATSAPQYSGTKGNVYENVQTYNTDSDDVPF